MNSTRRSHLSVSIYLSLGGGRFTVNTFCPPNFQMMGIMIENGEVINWDSFCASLCQPHLSKTCNEKWWAPAVHQILFPSPFLFSTPITGLAIKKGGKKKKPKPKTQKPVPSSSTAVIGQPALHFVYMCVWEGMYHSGPSQVQWYQCQSGRGSRWGEWVTEMSATWKQVVLLG